MYELVWKKIGSFFKHIGIIFILFIFFNIIAAYYVLYFPKQLWSARDEVLKSIISPTSHEGQEIIFRLFDKEGSNYIKAIQSTPAFKQHPILHYMVGPAKDAYHTVGIEGVRYFNENKDEDIKRILESDRAIYVLGGSTTFGYGVSNNQTIPFYLQDFIKQRSSYFVLNLGTPAYDQLREIDKLVYLLRSGYRPKIVIFIDGLNDIMGIARSNYRVQDKIIYQGFSVGKGDKTMDGSFLPQGATLTFDNLKSTLINALPLMRAYRNWKAQPITLAQYKFEKNSFIDPFDWIEAEYFCINWPDFGTANKTKLSRQIIELYSKNIKFLESLSKAFGFKYIIFFQPIGYISKNNPFIKPHAPTTKGYKYYEEMVQTIKHEVSKGMLSDIVDISDLLSNEKEVNYIDCNHYSPVANKKIASAIYKELVNKKFIKQ